MHASLHALLGFVDDPVFLDARSAIDVGFSASFFERRVGDFDNQSAVATTRVPMTKVRVLAAHDRDIRLRFTPLRRDRQLALTEPASRQLV